MVDDVVSVTIGNIPRSLWRRTKSYAVSNDLNYYQVVVQALEAFLLAGSDEEKPDALGH